MDNFINVTLPAISKNESLARSIVAAFSVALNPTLDELSDIKTAVSEAVTNSIVHGYPTGFLKAIRNFSFEFNVKFSTYAVPMIAGEVKRFLRDDGYIKVSRSVKGMSSKIAIFSEQYKQKTGESPSVETIAKEFEIEPTDVVFVLDSAKMPLSIYDESEDRAQIIDKLPSGGDENDRINNIMLCDLIRSLPERDKKIIVLRYYRDRTQCEVARILGVSQVQVSRLENKILLLLKQEIAHNE